MNNALLERGKGEYKWGDGGKSSLEGKQLENSGLNCLQNTIKQLSFIAFEV